MFTVHIDVDSLARETSELLSRIERASLDGLDESARLTATQARSQHWYQNRTGDLERSTQAVDAEGDVWSDSAQSAVAAFERYSVFVDARSPILQPAWDAVSSTAEHSFEAALARACE